MNTQAAKKLRSALGRSPSTDPLPTRIGIGTKQDATGLTTSEFGDGVIHTTRFDFSNMSVTMTDAGAAGSHGSQKLYDFPEGAIRILGAVANVTIARAGTNLTATSAIVAGVGTATVGTGNATLTTTEADVIPSTAATLSSGSGTFASVPTLTALTDNSAGTASDTLAAIPAPTDSPATADALRDDINTNILPVIRNHVASLAAKVNALAAGAAGQAYFDGSGTAKDLYLNFATPDAGSAGNDALTVNGRITIIWMNHGDK